METINDRIKLVRKAANLTQTAFGERIGITKNAVVNLEIPGRSKISDAYIKSICCLFGVREEWLRTGEGDMYAPKKTFKLDELIQSEGLTGHEAELAEKFVRMFCALDPVTRQNLVEKFEEYFGPPESE